MVTRLLFTSDLPLYMFPVEITETPCKVLAHAEVKIPEPGNKILLKGTKIYQQPDARTSVSFTCRHGVPTKITFAEDADDAQSAIFRIRAHYLAEYECDFTVDRCKSKGNSKVRHPGAINLRRAVRQAKQPTIRNIDTEYNGTNKVPKLSLPRPALEYPDTQIDEDLYQAFKVRLDQVLDQAGPAPPSSKMKAPIDVGDISDSAELHIPFIQGTPKYPSTPYVTSFPKLNSYTSDGKHRVIYIPSSGLIRLLDDNYGYIPLKLPYRIVGGPKFLGNSFKTYDITTCDKVLFPYWVRYVKESRPHHEHILLPRYILYDRHNKKWYQGKLSQFPSGLNIVTSVVSPCFLAAILDLQLDEQDKKYIQIQGDGFAAPHWLEVDSGRFPFLKRQVDNIINGFDYTLGFPRYMNAKKRLSSSRLLQRGVNGALKWSLRYEIYRRFLHAYDLPDHRFPHYQELLRFKPDQYIRDLSGEDISLIRYVQSLDSNNPEKLPHDLIPGYEG